MAIVLIASAGCQHSSTPVADRPIADQVFLNGAIYSVDASNSWFEAMAIADGRIIALGSNDEIVALQNSATQVIDVDGRMLMPGIQDMHLHPMDGGIKEEFECTFGADLDTQAIISIVAGCIAKTPEGVWVQGGQWNTNILEQSVAPTRQLLDAVSPNNPVFLMDWSVHNAWVNTRALQLLGIDAESENLVGGEILKGHDGLPNGILLDNAAYQARQGIPDYSKQQRVQALRYSLKQLAGFGVTSFRDALTTKANLDAYQELDAQNELLLRAKLSMPWKSSWSVSHAVELENITKHQAHSKGAIDASFAKIMLDGVPLTYTSAVLEPYEPSAKYGDAHVGELMLDAQTLAQDVAYLDATGLTVKIHATGDRAVQVALDAIAFAREKNGRSGLMHEISHAELIDPPDIARFHELNVAAEMCPILWYPNAAIDTMKLTIGERAERMWAVKSLIEAQANVFYGSDWPAVVPNTNPWPGIEAMVTRADPYGKNPGRLWPEQAVDLAQTLRVFTINGAITGKQADVTGSLEVGKWADFIVLDQNIFKIPITDVSETKVVGTFVQGHQIAGTQQW